VAPWVLWEAQHQSLADDAPCYGHLKSSLCYECTLCIATCPSASIGPCIGPCIGRIYHLHVLEKWDQFATHTK